MIKTLHEEQVNVLEFLSTENTDLYMNEPSFLKLVFHTFDAVKSHVIVDMNNYIHYTSQLNHPQGFYHQGSRMLIPPYPPNRLPFDYAAFLQLLQDAEADIEYFNYSDHNALESFDVLHRHLHDLMYHGISVPEFMAGRELALGTPGAVIYEYLLDSIDPTTDTEKITCGLFFAHVATLGSGALLWNLPASGARNLTRAEATAFVHSLVKVDVADIPKDSMRCSYCWSNFDEVVEGLDNRPVRLPCHSTHIVSRDCLIKVLTSSNICPLCKEGVVAMWTGNPRRSINT
jgi:hypothetical protein